MIFLFLGTRQISYLNYPRMKYIIDTNFGMEEVTIRIAHLRDVKNLVSINHKWQRHVLGEKIQNGFLSAEFSKQTFALLVKTGEIVVAEAGNHIAVR